MYHYFTYYFRTDNDEAMLIFFLSGYGQTTDGRIDRHDFGILIWKRVAHKKIQFKAQN